MKKTCSKCGMLANVDPWLHEERYGHVPAFVEAGVTYTHRGDGAFVDAEGNHPA